METTSSRQKTEPTNAWTVKDSKEIYNVEHWGEGFFDLNEQGEVVVYPSRKKHSQPINLHQLTKELLAKQLTLPILIRFPDILKQRVASLYEAFLNAIQSANYLGRYNAVYPIKTNQQNYVVSEMIHFPEQRVGLEAGSKPELLAVLALATQPGMLIICNGYKDREYIRLALIGQHLGHHVYIILEKYSELEIVLDEARKIGVKPQLGVRIRSASKLSGKWQKTGGEKSKFGLTASQVLNLIEGLTREGCLDWLQLLHFHFGSQIANILDIQKGIRECARYYKELRELGAPIKLVDVGGGLGIDYDGTHSPRFSSINYSMQEYANNIVFTLQEVCTADNLPHPDIVTESGRAMTAHHAVLITNVVGCETIQFPRYFCIEDADNILIKNLYEGLQSLTSRTAIEAYHDACYWMQEAHSKYLHGIMGMKERAYVEQLYLSTCWQVRELLKCEVKAHREVFDELNEKLADKFFVNFSIFQSLPDAWAIDQVFPILPLTGLEQVPDRRVILQDLTCDSDGCIDYYIDGQGLETTLPLPAYKPGQPYWLAMFLVGAYQEILGDMHNLFGDTDSVNVVLEEDGSYRLEQPTSGDLVKDVLRYVHFDPEALIRSYQKQLEESSLSEPAKKNYLAELIAGMHGYTYLED